MQRHKPKPSVSSQRGLSQNSSSSNNQSAQALQNWFKSQRQLQQSLPTVLKSHTTGRSRDVLGSSTDRTLTERFNPSPKPNFSNISNLYNSTQTAKAQRNFLVENKRAVMTESNQPVVESVKTTIQTAGFNTSVHQSMTRFQTLPQEPEDEQKGMQETHPNFGSKFYKGVSPYPYTNLELRGNGENSGSTKMNSAIGKNYSSNQEVRLITDYREAKEPSIFNHHDLNDMLTSSSPRTELFNIQLQNTHIMRDQPFGQTYNSISPEVSEQLKHLMAQADSMRTRACGTHGILHRGQRRSPSKKIRPGQRVTQEEIEKQRFNRRMRSRKPPIPQPSRSKGNRTKRHQSYDASNTNLSTLIRELEARSRQRNKVFDGFSSDGSNPRPRESSLIPKPQQSQRSLEPARAVMPKSIREFYQEKEFVEFLKHVNLYVCGQQDLQVEKGSKLYENLKGLREQFQQFQQRKQQLAEKQSFAQRKTEPNQPQNKLRVAAEVQSKVESSINFINQMYEKVCAADKPGKFSSIASKKSRQCTEPNRIISKATSPYSSMYTDSRSVSQERSQVSYRLTRDDLRRHQSSNKDIAEHLPMGGSHQIRSKRRLYISKRSSSKIQSPLARKMKEKKKLRSTISSSNSRKQKVENKNISRRKRNHWKIIEESRNFLRQTSGSNGNRFNSRSTQRQQTRDNQWVHDTLNQRQSEVFYEAEEQRMSMGNQTMKQFHHSLVQSDENLITQNSSVDLQRQSINRKQQKPTQQAHCGKIVKARDRKSRNKNVQEDRVKTLKNNHQAYLFQQEKHYETNAMNQHSSPTAVGLKGSFDKSKFSVSRQYFHKHQSFNPSSDQEYQSALFDAHVQSNHLGDTSNFGSKEFGNDTLTRITGFEPHAPFYNDDCADEIGQQTVQSPQSINNSSEHQTSAGSVENLQTGNHLTSPSNIYTERYGLQPGIERFFTNKFHPSNSDRNCSDGQKQPKREKRGGRQQRGQCQIQMGEFMHQLNQNSSQSELSRLNAFRDNYKESFKPSEQPSSYDHTSAVPDSDSMYENTYRPSGREQLYVETHTATENASDEKNEVLTQRAATKFTLKLKPSVSRDEEAFSFRRASLRNEPFNKYLKKYGVGY